MITAKQIAALKYLIFNSKDGTELTKRIIAHLIDHSSNLTKDVCLTLTCERDFPREEIVAAYEGFEALPSANRSTHLTEILTAMGCDLRLSYDMGDYNPNREDDPLECQVHEDSITFWLSKWHYSRQADHVEVTREDLEKIDLKKPGLYPSFESGQ